MAGYAAKGFSAVKMRVVGHDGFSFENAVRRIRAARRGIGQDVELFIDAHGALDVSTAIRVAKLVLLQIPLESPGPTERLRGPRSRSNDARLPPFKAVRPTCPLLSEHDACQARFTERCVEFFGISALTA